MKNKSDDQNADEKEISSVISSKILEYKSSLDAVPVQIIPIDQSENDRQKVNKFYQSLVSPSLQILDSKFYSQIIKMNRERDKSFLKEGTTRKERITILAQLISRVTTPVIYLNHKRNIQLSNFRIMDEKKGKNKDEKEKINYIDPIVHYNFPKELSGVDLQSLKEQVLQKTVNKTWDNVIGLKFDLTDWEADVLSQLIRDEELSVLVDNKNKKVKIVRTKEKKEKTKIISFLIEPEKSK